MENKIAIGGSHHVFPIAPRIGIQENIAVALAREMVQNLARFVG